MEGEYIETKTSYDFEHINNLELMNKNSFTERIQPPEMSRAHFEIIFNFSRVETHSDWVKSPEFTGPQLVRSVETSPREVMSVVRFDLQTFLSHKTVLRTINRKLRRWVPDKWRVYLREHSFYHAVEYMVLMPINHNVVFIDLNVVVDHQRIYHEDQWLDFVARTSMEENRLMMVPASDSSIESLEKRRTDSDANCVICTEDYPSGFEATFMPCSHCFHEDCIKEWLRVSHYCPICRFEMPQATTGSDELYLD